MRGQARLCAPGTQRLQVDQAFPNRSVLRQRDV